MSYIKKAIMFATLGLMLLVITAVPSSTALADTVIVTIDSTNQTGRFTSLELNGQGFPVISYVDHTNTDLKLAVCHDASCSSSTVTTVDGIGTRVGYGNSLKLDSNGFPVISYFDSDNSDLKLAVCHDVNCISSTISTIDSEGFVGQDTSLELNSNDIPIISYYSFTNNDLKIAICNDTICSSPTLKIIDNGTNTGQYSSLELTSDERPVISYQAYQDLGLAVCHDAACTSWTTKKIDTSAGRYTSLALTKNDIPVISYSHYSSNSFLRVAVCHDMDCTTSTRTTIDNIGWYNSIEVDDNDIPVVSYWGYGDGIRLAYCHNTRCNSANKVIVNNDSPYNGQYSSLELNDNGYPIISYYARSTDLDIAICDTPTCSQTGTIVIDKVTSPSYSSQPFTFTHDIASPFEFSIYDVTAARAFYNVVPGTYTVTETSLLNWQLTDLVCIDPDNGSTVDVASGIATIDVDAGEIITCTYTNLQTGSTDTPTPSPTYTPSDTPTASATFTPSNTPTATYTPTITPTPITVIDGVYMPACGDTAALIDSINLSVSGDTISLAEGCTYTLTEVNNVQGNGYSGLPIIDKVLTIEGNGATIARSTESGIPEFRIFSIQGYGHLILDGLTIANGLVTHNGQSSASSGMYIGYGSMLEIRNSVISGNDGYFSITNYQGTLDIINSSIENNNASAIHSTAAITNIINSNISSNTRYQTIDYTNGTVNIINSTISGNSGGISGRGNLNIVDSTILDNRGISQYGGILDVSNSVISDNANSIISVSGGMVILSNSTVSNGIYYGVHVGNGTADISNSTISSNGTAGIYTATHNDSVTTVQGSIIAGNGSGTGDIVGSVVSNGYNLIQDTTGATITGDETTNIYGQDPLLGVLQDNGGDTWTMALSASSPAIDAGGTCGLATDQRGALRNDSFCDIGAFEYGSFIPTPTPTYLATQTPTNTPTPSASYTPTNTPTPSATYTPTVTSTPTFTLTPVHPTPASECAAMNLTNRAGVDIAGMNFDENIDGDYAVWYSHDGVNDIVNLHQISTDTTMPIFQRANTGTVDSTIPAISGNHVVWQWFDGTNYDIYAYDIATGVVTEVTQGNTDNDDLANLDGDYVIWRKQYGDGSGYDLYSYDFSTGIITNLTNDPTVYDGYAFISGDYAVWGTTIYQFNTGTKTEVTLPGSYLGYRIDGNYVTWGVFENNEYDVYLYNITTTELTNISNAVGYDDTNPYLRGDYVVWAQDDDSTYTGVYLYQISTGIKTYIADMNLDTGNYPHVMTDSNYVIWQDMVGSFYDTFMYDISSGEITNISNSNDGNDVWAFVDGNHVVWNWDNGSEYEMYLYAINCVYPPTATPTPEATNEITPEVTPEITPEVTPEITPEITPEVTPEVTSEVTPEITPEVTPEITPEVTVEITPEATPEITPELTSEATPEITPEATVEVTPEITAEVTPTATPLPIVAISINEQAVYTTIETVLANNPDLEQIDFVLVDIVPPQSNAPGGMNLTIRLTDGRTGHVFVSMIEDNGFIKIQIADATPNGTDPPGQVAFRQAINAELPTILTNALNSLIGEYDEIVSLNITNDSLVVEVR